MTAFEMKPLTSHQIPLPVFPLSHCAYCWKRLFPNEPYPKEWSSTFCKDHVDWVKSKYLLSCERKQRNAH